MAARKKAAQPDFKVPEPDKNRPSDLTLPEREKARKEALKAVGAREEKIKGARSGTRAENAAKRAAAKEAEPKKKTKRCGAKLRNPERQGETCNHPAGWSTSHPGFGKCKLHGGSTPSLVKAAETEMVNERMAKEGSMYGERRNIGPHEALIEEVQRTAGHVIWLEHKIQQFQNEQALVQYTGKDGMKESEWVAMYREERKMLVAVCNTAIRCGIAERTVKIAEDQGKIIAGMLLKLINNPVLALTPAQMEFAPRLARDLLLEIASGGVTPEQKMIGSEIVDAEVIYDT